MRLGLGHRLRISSRWYQLLSVWGGVYVNGPINKLYYLNGPINKLHCLNGLKDLFDLVWSNLAGVFQIRTIPLLSACVCIIHNIFGIHLLA